MQKVIVTGGAGFIGSNLVDELIKQEIEVIVLDNLLTGKQENINPRAVFYQCDVSRMPMNTFDYLFKERHSFLFVDMSMRKSPNFEYYRKFNKLNIKVS